ncbi:LamB/YcsF family protein [Agrobacterium rubi]|uniref:5-oxoprolinase subunit PxpA n=1 Tax=Agrobacterium rubi TaxID=28099 RepID=UPI001573AFE0|nr:5-oxoprolinase subunit PxpA [Agrobacterium rubi]NTF10541.1 LamB/YcsF family protein [Agrobacterium rubi]NTF22935.1 LamB/YcsF family protein [Agrobacterium rubi]NTF29866.1 LamB/YcsF family protein [Agrobacterium rubi]
MTAFDINCDMGEGFGNWRMSDDAGVMPLISSANIACGFHAGDPVNMQTVVRLAKENGVAVGAHPGLPDLLGFGRRVMSVTPNEIYAYIIYQTGALKGFLEAEGMKINHVKPHGAMFLVLKDRILADAAIDAIQAVAPRAAIYWSGPAGREPFTVRAAERGLKVVYEAYPDLHYSDEGSLVIERHKAPVEANLVYERVREILTEKTLLNRNGVKLPMDVDSVCIHSDSPNSIEIINAAREAIADSDRVLGCPTNQ